MTTRHALFLFLVALLGWGCSANREQKVVKEGKGAESRPQAELDGWTLVGRDPAAPTATLLWNGLIGVRIGRDGSGVTPDGKPLPCFAIDEYETDGFERIRQIPNLLAYGLEESSNQVFGIGEGDKPMVENYSQELDMRTGILTTRWSESAATDLYPFEVLVETAIHPDRPIVAQRFTLSGGDELGFRLWDVNGPSEKTPSYQTKVLDDRSVWSQLTIPSGRVIETRLNVISPAEAVVEADEWTAAVGVAVSTDAPTVLERSAWVSGNESLVDLSFEAVAKASRATWAKRWETDIEIEGPVEDQQAIRSWLFYLRSAIHPDGNMSISPMGLSSQDYNGHVFWDADLWVFPALALLDPVAAKEIPDYRIKGLQKYQNNWIAWMKQGKPTAKGKSAKPNPNAGKLAPNQRGLKVPWESSVTGKEVAPPGQWRFQDHITGTVAFSVDMAAALGLCQTESAKEVRDAARRFYDDRAPTRVPDGASELFDTMSPDEHHIADNDLYTNLVAQWCFNGGNWDTAVGRGLRMKLPKDDKGFLTYDDDPVRSYKQAAAVLAIYPLQYPQAEKEAKQMMERFADKVIENGPAMTDAIHATIWARLGETEKAYETWRKGWKEFARPPHLLFSETRAKDETYFTTGAGGCLQTVIYGFLGFRIDLKKEPGAAWSLKLNGDRWLSVKPHLPKAWKRVTIRNFTVLGERYTLTATHESVQATRGD